MKVEPIRPEECENGELPDFVIIGTNNCVNKHYHNGTSHFLQDDLIDEILEVAPDYVTRQMLFDKYWLDVEETYRKVGWKVEYDKPGYNESYKANFTFSRPSR